MPTAEQYDEAVADLLEAKAQLGDPGNYCYVCTDSGHTAETCGFNPLVAMQICHGIAERARQLHDLFHCHGDEDTTPEISGEFLEQMHHFLHYLAGFDQHMGEQRGPAKVVVPDGNDCDGPLTLKRLERLYILSAYAKHKHMETGAKAATAKDVGVSLKTMYTRLREYGA